jgi:putative phage-type endonuclease
MTARLILPAGAPRDEWLAARRQGVTASEIAALLGISPYQSPFNLYWVKTGQITEDFDNERLSLGRHMEPWIAERFTDEHPDLHLTAPAGLWGSVERLQQLATPDGLVYDSREVEYGRDEQDAPLSVWEGKTSGTYEGWGDDGTDEIPAYIAAQVQWQMDVLGVDHAYVSCFFLLTQKTRTYVIAYDQADVELMRTRALEFWGRVQDGNPPEIDGHTATTLALKRLYPDADDAEEAQVPADLATRYRTACDAVKRADERKAGVENEIRAAMGNAKRAVTQDGQKVATRSVYDRKPYSVGPARIDALKPATSKKKDAA